MAKKYAAKTSTSPEKKETKKEEEKTESTKAPDWLWWILVIILVSSLIALANRGCKFPGDTAKKPASSKPAKMEWVLIWTYPDGWKDGLVVNAVFRDSNVLEIAYTSCTGPAEFLGRRNGDVYSGLWKEKGGRGGPFELVFLPTNQAIGWMRERNSKTKFTLLLQQREKNK